MSQSFESELSQCIHSALGARPSGTLVIDADDGCIGTSGGFESGIFRRKRVDVTGLPDNFHDLIEKSYEASKANPKGPWYRCEIAIQPRQGFHFTYFWLADALKDINSIPKGILGGLPGGVLRARFDAEVLERLEDHEISGAILAYVPSMSRAGHNVSSKLMDLYGVADWHGDSNNGSLNQYFARTLDPYSGFDRASLYGATLRGLEAIGHTEGLQHFSKALAVYSHLYERVDAVRKSLDIAAVSGPDEHPVVDDYWDIEPRIQSLLANHVRANVVELAGG